MKTPSVPFETFAAHFRVLSDPARLKLVYHLAELKESSVGRLVTVTEMLQPVVSRHLRALHDAGFLGRRREGTTVFYFIEDKSLMQLCDIMCQGITRRLERQVRELKRLR